jgi:hypothetical protein
LQKKKEKYKHTSESWQRRLINSPGASLLCAVAPAWPSPGARLWRPASDAAVGDAMLEECRSFLKKEKKKCIGKGLLPFMPFFSNVAPCQLSHLRIAVQAGAARTEGGAVEVNTCPARRAVQT